MICILRSTQNNNIITCDSNLDFLIFPRCVYTAHLDIIICITYATKSVTKSSLRRMARECSTINLIIDIILLNILHISALSLVRPVAYPTLFHILRPLDCFSYIWDESETIIDVVCRCSDKRCQKFLFIYESNWRIQCPTIFEETSKCWLKKSHKYIFDNVH